MIAGAWLCDPSARDSTCWTPSTQAGWYRPEQSIMNALLHHAGVTSPDSDSITLVELIADFSLLLHIKSIFNVPGTQWNKMSARGLPYSPWVLFIPGGATERTSLAYFVRCKDICGIVCSILYVRPSISSQQNASVSTSPFAGFFKIQNSTVSLQQKEGGNENV